ncbi:MAG: glycosyltransferase [Planctomycetes bacterium]|nr:glycosyltransferase [Planctomycetota bacterium]
MRITWLLEVADQLWGGVKVALEDANWLHRRGHQVTVVSRSKAPDWMRLECPFVQVSDFRPEHLPDGDVIVGTFWTTVPWSASAGASKGVPVHFCQGYEGDTPENAALRDRIESIYRLPGVHHVTISSHLTQLLRDRFGIQAHQVTYAIDHAVHHPGPERAPGTPLRIGLVGPYGLAWKDLATGYAACKLAHAAGQKLVLVRASNVPQAPAERDVPFPVEWHQQLPPARMGDYYRSLDVLLATSSGGEEGFFLPAIEAMACGVPTVLTDVPCFRDHAHVVGHGDYALFVPPKDPAAMAEALVLAGALPEVRQGLRRGGLQVAAHYHPDRHGAQFEAVLQEIVRTTGAKPSLRLVSPSVAEAATEPIVRQLRTLADRMQAAGAAVASARMLAAAQCLLPDDEALRLAAAERWLLAGDARAALRLVDDLVERGVAHGMLHQLRGQALHALGDLRAAALAFRAGMTAGPRSADAWNRLGVVLFQAGDVTGARDSFVQALALQPDHGDARANLASLPAA